MEHALSNHWLLLGVLAGLWAAIGDQAAVQIARGSSCVAGVGAWLTLALAPLVALSILSNKLALVAGVVGAALSAGAHWQSLQAHLEMDEACCDLA